MYTLILIFVTGFSSSLSTQVAVIPNLSAQECYKQQVEIKSNVSKASRFAVIVSSTCALQSDGK